MAGLVGCSADFLTMTTLASTLLDNLVAADTGDAEDAPFLPAGDAGLGRHGGSVAAVNTGLDRLQREVARDTHASHHHVPDGGLRFWVATCVEGVVVLVLCWVFEYVFHNPMCGVVFQCGCTFPWAGGWINCNVRLPVYVQHTIPTWAWGARVACPPPLQQSWCNGCLPTLAFVSRVA